MTKPKIINSKQYKVLVAAARDAGGDENQAHFENRLKAAVKRRVNRPAKRPVKRPAKPVKKPAIR